MGGAFVAVADDATAVYWNPAGLALGGSYFGMVLDFGQAEGQEADLRRAGSQSSRFFGLTALPLGLSYYRLSASKLTPGSDPDTVRLTRLTTQHAGITLVQSVTGRVAVASTVRWVRGHAAIAEITDAGGEDLDDLLDRASDLPDGSANKFDADIGVMAALGVVRAGLTVRNVTEPDFETPAGETVSLERQTRAGISYVGVPGVILAADIDLERAAGSLGEIRDFAAGAEARPWPRVSIRSGFRFNTLGDEPGGRAPVYSLGGSVATFRSLLIDAQVTLGAREGDRGWGIAARLGY
jgi:hypothetical protein